ncbi:MAG: hypothetical protein DMG93_17055 [Acidobacteria bacterium]|nr:MAG: hypothetical protein DMG93_17055 [Acidobacteriota bacterium]
MAAIMLHAAHGCECPRSLFGELRNTEIAERARHLPRVQKKSNVCRRDPRRYNKGIFLHVIGNQPVVLLGAELSEVAPGANGSAS